MFVVKDVVGGAIGLFLVEYVEKGSVVKTLEGSVSSIPTQTSIKVGENRHIEDVYGRFVNHNCNPTVKVEGGRLVALRDLKPGDEVSFCYPDNEDTLVVPFTCFCCGKSIG